MPEAICELTPGSANLHVLINREKPPFDNADLRRAMALAIDRQAFVETLMQGKGDIGGILQPPPGGLWGMPPDQLKQLPGYDPDVRKNRQAARQLMNKLGYGPDVYPGIGLRGGSGGKGRLAGVSHPSRSPFS